MKSREHALNAAACINRYMSASINDLIRNNKEFQEKDAESRDFRVPDSCISQMCLRIIWSR